MPSNHDQFKDIDKIEDLVWGGRTLKQLSNKYLNWIATNVTNDRYCTAADTLLRYRKQFGIDGIR